jgi:hypothetical protein
MGGKTALAGGCAAARVSGFGQTGHWVLAIPLGQARGRTAK